MRHRTVVLTAALASMTLSLPVTAAPKLVEVVVVLEESSHPVAQRAQQIAQAHTGEVGFIYTSALQGFTLTIPEPAIEGLRGNPHIAYIEPVQTVSAVGTQPIPTGIDRIEGDLNPPSVPMDVDIAILDTGVYIGTNPDGSSRSHLDLNLRWVSDCTGAIFYPLFGGCSGSGDFQDYHGHGTHVAGIAAALDNDIGSVGVAPGATLWSFKVLQADGTGTTGMILAGIDGVTSKADQIEVANMSLGFVGTSQAINDAIANATNAGVVFVVAAGNDAIDASQFSPANAPDVITVSALADFDGLPGGLGAPTCRTDVDDTLADFSNFGSTVEIAAPGVCIFSTDLNDGYSVKSGTSMASPFVAGAVARYIAQTNAPTSSRADVEAIKAAVIGAGVPQTSICGFADVDTSPEPLLFVNGSGFGGDGTCGGSITPPPPLNQPPQASFASSCIDLTCTYTNTSTDPDGDPLGHLWDFGDGATSSEEHPIHTYSTSGTYTVTLTVDDGEATDTVSESVTVTSSPPPSNQPPQASFTSSCTDLTCTFTSTSTDPDGDTLSYAWDFGDTNTSSEPSPTHTYAAAGAYTVSLTVGDGSLSDSVMTQVEVTAPPPPSSVVTATVNPLLDTGRDAEAALNVFNDAGDYVSGATIEGVFTYLDRRGRERSVTSSGVSGDPFLYHGAPANALLTARLPRNSELIGFCITTIEAAGYTYVPSLSACAVPFGVDAVSRAAALIPMT